MDIKITCALAILNACLGNDPSQVTERMNALKDIDFFNATVLNPYIEVLMEKDISPQTYCEYSLMPMMKVIRFTPLDLQKWREGLDKVHDIVNWYYLNPHALPLYEHVAFNLLRYNNCLRKFVQNKDLCDDSAKQTLTKLYKMIPRTLPVDYGYESFLNDLNAKGIEYAVLNNTHHKTVRYVVTMDRQKRVDKFKKAMEMWKVIMP